MLVKLVTCRDIAPGCIFDSCIMKYRDCISAGHPGAASVRPGLAAALGVHASNPWDRSLLQRCPKRFGKGSRTRFANAAASGFTFSGSHYDTNSGMFENWDPDSEEYRSERRTTYNFDDWKKHRSWERYFRHFKTLPRSGIFNSLLRPVAWVTAVSIVMMAYVSALQTSILPEWMPQMLTLPIEPFQLTSFALSLLLVFRTNSSYQRWFEGRRRFGAVTHFSRDLARQAFAYFKPHDMERKAMFARWLVAFFTSVYCQLREGANLEQELQPLLRPAELRTVLRSSNPANFSLQMVSSLISSSGIASQLVAKMDHDLTLIVDALSSCERIVSTPIPLSYTRHTARFMMMWLFALPFSLWSSCGWLTVPIMLTVSFILLGIEEIGVQIEEPFGILAMERMCERNKEHVFSMYREHLNVIQVVNQFEKDRQWSEQWWRDHVPGSSKQQPDTSQQQEDAQASAHAGTSSAGNGFNINQWRRAVVGSVADGVNGSSTSSSDWQVIPDPNELVLPLPNLMPQSAMAQVGSRGVHLRQGTNQGDNGSCSSNTTAATSSSSDQSFNAGTAGNCHSDPRHGAMKNGMSNGAKLSHLKNLHEPSVKAGATEQSRVQRSMASGTEKEHGAGAGMVTASSEAGSSLGQAVMMNTYLRPY